MTLGDLWAARMHQDRCLWCLDIIDPTRVLCDACHGEDRYDLFHAVAAALWPRDYRRRWRP